jgi:mannose-6-phosphate isomerase-like protein (cupin superfamily)
MSPEASTAGSAFEAHPMMDPTSTTARPARVYEWGGYEPLSSAGSWCVRGQNFVVMLSKMSRGEQLRVDAVPDEHAILIPAGAAVAIETDAGGAELDEEAFVVAPAGSTMIRATRPSLIVRVFTSRAASIVSNAANAEIYEQADPRVTLLDREPAERGPRRLRVFPLSKVPADARRFGRVFRTDSLMVNWFLPQLGPRDVRALSPHVHDDFEQLSLTLEGDHVHHLRTPWTAVLDDWRPDEHRQVGSPSVTIIPAGVIHTTRAVGLGYHQLIDVFAPPRKDFLDAGWVLNQGDYE